jgi:predicted Rossmann fold nucleotide-binding protein DprA/Smf involved in DNA uptake
METVHFDRSDPIYPSVLRSRLGKNAPQSIAAIGNLDILACKTMALFCSVKCPGNLILQTYNFVQELRQSGVTVIGGFHSPMERECLGILLRGTQPVIICPAKIIKNMRIASEHKQAIKEGRLLFMSPFEEGQRRISVKTSQFRNLFVAALSEQVFVAHAEPGGKTENLCRDILSWKKPIYTFNSDYNKNLIEMGVQPIGTGGPDLAPLLRA